MMDESIDRNVEYLFFIEPPDIHACIYTYIYIYVGVYAVPVPMFIENDDYLDSV